VVEGYPTRFVIFAAPRTGSNLLCSLLDSHPDILCHHGLFNPEGIHCAARWCDVPGRLGRVDLRDHDPLTFLKRVWEADDGRRAVGFKINRGENATAVQAVLRDPTILKILLKRRNRVRTFVSEMTAQATGAWESYGPRDEKAPPVLRVDPTALRRHADMNAAYYGALERDLSSSGQEWLQTDYEALIDWDEMARVLNFLGVSEHAVTADAPLTAASHKRAPSDLSATVANLKDLYEALRGTPLFRDLSERDAPELHLHRPTLRRS
jgi:hypothetical protein